MIGKDSKSDGTVSLNNVSEILESRRKEREPIYEQEIALEHSKKFILSKAQYEKLEKKLNAINGMKRSLVYKILDIRPTTEMLLRQILAADKITLDESTIKEIVTIMKEAE